MGYRIDYAGPTPQIKSRINRTGRFRTLIAVSFLFFSILVRLLWPEGTKALQSVFLPLELSAAEQAFIELLDDVHRGQPLDDAVITFCHRIVHEVH